MVEIVAHRPRIVSFNGKATFERYFGQAPVGWGAQERRIGDAPSLVYVTPSSSGRANGVQAEREAAYRALGALVRGCTSQDEGRVAIEPRPGRWALLRQIWWRSRHQIRLSVNWRLERMGLEPCSNVLRQGRDPPACRQPGLTHPHSAMASRSWTVASRC